MDEPSGRADEPAIRKATVKRFRYESHDQPRTHVADFMAACKVARRLKTLSGLTPYEYAASTWAAEPDRFIVNSIRQMPGLNTWMNNEVRGRRAEQEVIS